VMFTKNGAIIGSPMEDVSDDQTYR
jgi:hypothetical protein